MVVDGSPRPAENSAESSPSQHGQGISTVRDSCVHVRCRPIVFCCVLRLAAVRVSLVSRGAGVKTLKDLSSDEVTGHTPTLLSRSGLWCYKPVVYKQQHQDFQTKFLVFFSSDADDAPKSRDILAAGRSRDTCRHLHQMHYSWNEGQQVRRNFNATPITHQPDMVAVAGRIFAHPILGMLWNKLQNERRRKKRDRMDRQNTPVALPNCKKKEGKKNKRRGVLLRWRHPAELRASSPRKEKRKKVREFLWRFAPRDVYIHRDGAAVVLCPPIYRLVLQLSL